MWYVFQARKRNSFGISWNILVYLGISWNSKDLGMQSSVFKILKNIYSVICVTISDLFY